MTAPSREDAVRAVAEALSDLCADELGDYPCPGHYRQATAALDALTPYIAAVVAADRQTLAERLDKAVNGECKPGCDYCRGWDTAVSRAAAVIRSAPPWGTTEEAAR
jgi:hypothetical protein